MLFSSVFVKIFLLFDAVDSAKFRGPVVALNGAPTGAERSRIFSQRFVSGSVEIDDSDKFGGAFFDFSVNFDSVVFPGPVIALNGAPTGAERSRIFSQRFVSQSVDIGDLDKVGLHFFDSFRRFLLCRFSWSRYRP